MLFFFELCLIIFHRHLKEIQDLQSRQKHEIESLYTKLGKVPPAVIIPPAAPLSGRRRRPTKSKGSKSSRISSLGSKSPQLSGKKPCTRSAMAVPSFVFLSAVVYITYWTFVVKLQKSLTILIFLLPWLF